MSLTIEDLSDLTLETYKRLIKAGAFVGLQTDLQDFVAVRELYKNHKKVFAGGEAWRFELQVDHNHSAREVGLYEVDGSVMNDTMIKAEVPIRYINAHFVYDLREPLFQRGGHAITDIMKTKSEAMHMSVFELLEDRMWSKPVDSSDLRTVWGIAYWVVRSATEGFNGGNPSGFPLGCAGVSSSTYSRWRNYTAQYAAVSHTDLLRKMRRAHQRTLFRSPLSHAQPDLGAMGNGIYCNGDTLLLLEELCEQQNMNLGNDLDSKGGRAVFKGTPMVYVPKLDADSAAPVYMLDWKHMRLGAQAGWENNTTAPYQVPGMHTVRRVDMDASLNLVCTNRRRQAVISK